MASLFEMLQNQLSGNTLTEISQRIGADEAGTATAMTTALPVLLGALARNTSTPDGATALHRALAKDHDGRILDNIGQHLANSDAQTGNGILGHLLGDRRTMVEQQVSKVSGLEASSVSSLLTTVAPLLMGLLGRAQQQGGLNPASLAGLIGSEEQGMVAKSPGLGRLAQLLDSNHDGSIADDLARVGKGLLGKLGR